MACASDGMNVQAGTASCSRLYDSQILAHAAAQRLRNRSSAPGVVSCGKSRKRTQLWYWIDCIALVRHVTSRCSTKITYMEDLQMLGIPQLAACGCSGPKAWRWLRCWLWLCYNGFSPLQKLLEKVFDDVVRRIDVLVHAVDLMLHGRLYALEPDRVDEVSERCRGVCWQAWLPADGAVKLL